MRKLKKFLKKFSSLRMLNKKLKKSYWKVSDAFKLQYYKVLGKPTINVYYARLKNFGDQFNNDLLSYFGYELTYVDNYKLSDVALTGSILQHYKSDFEGKVLGAGFIDEKYKRNHILWDVKIIRGPLSAKQCGLTNNVAFGDPGLLASLMFKKRVVKKYKLGLVPHYVDYDNAVSKFSSQKGVKIINVRQSPKKVAQEIKSCEFIASSSLHGLIFADSFRIPNIHLRFGDLLLGGLHKFKDYYEGMNAENEVLDYNNDLKINEIVKRCKLRFSSEYLNLKQNELMKIMKLELLDIKMSK